MVDVWLMWIVFWDPGVEPEVLFVAEVPKWCQYFFDFFDLPRIDRKNPLRLTKKTKVRKAWESAYECRSKVIFVVLYSKNTRLRGQSFTIPATNGR